MRAPTLDQLRAVRAVIDPPAPGVDLVPVEEFVAVTNWLVAPCPDLPWRCLPRLLDGIIAAFEAASDG